MMLKLNDFHGRKEPLQLSRAELFPLMTFQIKYHKMECHFVQNKHIYFCIEENNNTTYRQ
jgi:hypothetical protein